MNFRKGQKVVCVNPKSVFSCPNPLVKGKIYTVSQIYICPCSSVQLCLEEADYNIDMECECGRIEGRTQSYYTWRFRKLYLWDLYCNLFEIKNEEGEKEDIEIPAPVKTINK